jgi:YegS/Rv2252/BmrU family lipid kinase
VIQENKMRIKLIANPISGGDSRPRIKVAKDLLQQAGAEVDLVFTRARGDARTAAALAESEGYDRVVAAGGDGTLNEVVNGITSSELPIAFLPCGTVNVFALEAGLPKLLEELCPLIVHGEPRKVTLGRVNGEFFLLMASAGWDAEAVARVRPGVKRVVGRLAYTVSALEAFFAKQKGPITLALPGGQSCTGYGVVISNCRYYGGKYVVTPEASMFHEQLHLCLLQQKGRLALLKFAFNLLFGHPLKSPLVELLTLSEVDISGEDIPIQVDGDDWGKLPVRIEAVPNAVTMVLPG